MMRTMLEWLYEFSSKDIGGSVLGYSPLVEVSIRDNQWLLIHMHLVRVLAALRLELFPVMDQIWAELQHELGHFLIYSIHSLDLVGLMMELQTHQILPISIVVST